MVYYAEEDEYDQDLPEITDEHNMEERLVEALGYHVQDSVNQALIKALKPFTQPLVRFGHRELRGRSLPETDFQLRQSFDVGFAQRASKGSALSAEILAHMAAPVIKDHKYGSFPALEVPETNMESSFQTEGNPLSISPSSGSDRDQDEPNPSGKHKSKSHNTQEGDQAPHNLSFDLENTIRPRSTEWIPCAEVAHYVEDRIRKGFDRDVRKTKVPDPSYDVGGGRKFVFLRTEGQSTVSATEFQFFREIPVPRSQVFV
ncbi:hypothetical protein NDU88_002310 [Pleurodeles waltl]|uniref:Uncharacterized protein n=1 Tax=Pleurodeles waltl TaxID=8319 RepID=A0AAV7LF88_PLEWA|nr:hypothetical protein NDU88_002310 [Pleurodeles waltl]